MNLAVVIPSFETPPIILRRCLESILNQVGAESLEIIVVESSLNKLPEELLEFQDRVRFFLPKRRMLAGEARNFGAAQTDKEFLAFLDADCLWHSNWLQVAKDLLDRHPNGLAFNGQILFEDLYQNWALALHIMEFHEFLATKPFHQRFLHSGNLLIRSSFFKSIGGFQIDWPACQDIGFLKSFQNSPEVRAEIRFEPKLSITHTSHLTDKDQIKQKAHFMGYWRGFYDAELPEEFQISKRKSFILLKRVLGLIFFALIFVRSLKLKSCYLARSLAQPTRLLALTTIWAKGFREGFKQRKIH